MNKSIMEIIEMSGLDSYLFLFSRGSPEDGAVKQTGADREAAVCRPGTGHAVQPHGGKHAPLTTGRGFQFF